MKNTALTSAVLLLILTGCAPEPQQFSTEETCSKLKAIIAGHSDSPSADERKKIAEQLEVLSREASESLKSEIELTAGHASLTDDQLNSLSEEDSARLDAAGEKIGHICWSEGS